MNGTDSSIWCCSLPTKYSCQLGARRTSQTMMRLFGSASSMQVFILLLLVMVLGMLIPKVHGTECLSCVGVPCQKVTGLFTRATLPVGYNVIATIPIRACNLTVMEMENTENYLALRSNHKYIINGNWDVLPSGRYMGAGTGFFYSHPARSYSTGQESGMRFPSASRLDVSSASVQGERIQAPGPLTQQLELMIIYQSTNKGVSYEYWRPLLSGESTNSEAVASAGRISPDYYESEEQMGLISAVTSESGPRQPGRSPGVGPASYQNFRNPLVRENGGQNARRSPSRSTQESSPSASSQQQDITEPGTLSSRKLVQREGRFHDRNPNFRNRRRKNRRRKLNNQLYNVQPAFSSFSSFQNQEQQQGANRRGPLPTFANDPTLLAPPSRAPFLGTNYLSGYGSDVLDLPILPGNQLGGPVGDALGLATGYVPGYNATEILFPAWKVWQFTPCSKSCGGGEQQSVYICTSVGGHVVSESLCGGEAAKPLSQTMECNTKPCPPQWQLSDWSPCSVTCGGGQQIRTWACIQVVSPTLTRAVDPTSCPIPTTHVPLTKPCTVGECTRWNVHLWSECSVDCGTGVRTREVHCLLESEAVTSFLPDAACNAQEKPPHQQLCHAANCIQNTWFFTEWSDQCIGGCESGRQYRRVWCSSDSLQQGGPAACPARSRPAESQPCSTEASCAAIWFTGPWSKCSGECGGGNRTREVVCVVFLRGSFRATMELECDPRSRPLGREPCNTQSCPPHWYFTEWTSCSRSCGRGSQQRSVQCLDTNQRPSLECSLSSRPSMTRVCNLGKCRSRGQHSDSPQDQPPADQYPTAQGSVHQASGHLSPSSSGCSDRFRNCRLVQQARLCRYTYYATVCCTSCTE